MFGYGFFRGSPEKRDGQGAQAGGFVKSKQGQATAERGGRAKMFFEITGKGQAALNASLNALDRLRSGTKLAGATARNMKRKNLKMVAYVFELMARTMTCSLCKGRLAPGHQNESQW